MLLGEIVKGCYLVKVIVMMYKICCEVEVVIFYRQLFDDLRYVMKRVVDIYEVIVFVVVVVLFIVNVVCIICFMYMGK